MFLSDDLKLRALAVTTRRRLFEILEQAPAPLSVAELAEALDVHQNTVRLHLDTLIAASLVETATAVSSSGRGRPSVRYRVVEPEADPVSVDARAQGHLAGWLAMAVTPEAARHVGEGIGAAAAAGDDAGVDGLVRLLAAEGFDPVVDDRGAIVIRHCPFGDVVAIAPAAVCALHEGIVSGFAGAHGDPGALRLFPHDPSCSACTIGVTAG